MARRIIETIEDDSVPPKKLRKTRVVEEHPTTYISSSDLLLAKVNQIVWFVLAIIEVIIAFRVILKILGASSFSPFANFIYAISFPFVAPFNGILRSSFGPNGSVIEWSSVLAGIVYAVIAWIIVYLFEVLHPVHTNHIDEGEVVD